MIDRPPGLQRPILVAAAKVRRGKLSLKLPQPRPSAVPGNRGGRIRTGEPLRPKRSALTRLSYGSMPVALHLS